MTLLLCGLELKVDRRESSSTMPRDTIISQLPPGGSGIKKGRQVQVVVSRGPSDTLTPKVVGELYRKADMIIRQAGYFPDIVGRVSSDTVERDVVIAQAPPFDSPLDKGGRISLLVSSGRKNPVFVMPKLTEKNLEEAIRTLDRSGLRYRVTYKPGGEKAAPRTVINQKPQPGFPVDSDAVVEIAASS